MDSDTNATSGICADVRFASRIIGAIGWMVAIGAVPLAIESVTTQSWLQAVAVGVLLGLVGLLYGVTVALRLLAALLSG
jgi:hypothetical protein